MADIRSNRFVWYELLTTDVAAAKAFYVDVVGWTTRAVSMPGFVYGLFDAATGPVAGLVEMPQGLQQHAAPHWMGYVAVADLDSTVAGVMQLGGAVRVAPTDIPDISRFAVVADPQNATLALVKGSRPSQAGAAALGTPGHVGWHELFAADWEKAFSFYSKLFGWQKTHADVGPTGKYQQFATGGDTLGAMSTKPETLSLPFWLYYFNVGDIEIAAKRVKDRGGEILYGPIAVPGGSWIVHCKDPQGAIFGLLDRRSRKAIENFVSSTKRDGHRRRDE
jgi:uncharacterized protein